MAPAVFLLTFVLHFFGPSALGQDAGTFRLPDNPRDLPSIIVDWKVEGPVGGVLLRDGLLYVAGAGDLSAIDPGTGAVRWRTRCTDTLEDTFGTGGPVAAGDAIAVSFGNQLCLVDAVAGTRRHIVVLGTHIHRLLEAPLVALVFEEEGRGSALVAVDPASGDVTARREIAGMVRDLRATGDLIVALQQGEAARPPNGSLPKVLRAYRAPDLAEAWSTPFDGGGEIKTIAGRLHVESSEGRSDRWRWRPVDPLTGRLGAPLPSRPRSDLSGGLDTWELQETSLNSGRTSATVRRNALRDGSTLWSLRLPDSPYASTVEGGRLYLHCGGRDARGILLVVDWNDGRVLRAAFGFRKIRGLIPIAAGLLAWTDDGVMAFSPATFAGPERNRDDLDGEVVTTLDRVRCDPADAFGASEDLITLGPAVLPLVTARIPSLGEAALVTAATIVATSGYRPAATVLAARLAGSPPTPACGLHWTGQGRGAEPSILRALAAIGGPAEVDAVAAIATDASRDADVRRDAFMTLASIGSPQAMRVVSDLLGRRRPRSAWYVAPEPEDDDERSARVELPDGRRLLVFRNPYLGGAHDVWAVAVDASGRQVAPAHFVGAVAGDLAASVSGRTLAVTGQSGRALRVALSDVGRDADGDGLPDLVERRLRCDHTRRDTDGDGTPDAEDPTPRGSRPPVDDDDRIALAIVEQYFLFHQDPQPLLIQHDVPLPWDAWPGVTLTLNRREARRFGARVGFDARWHMRALTLRPGVVTDSLDEDVAADLRRSLRPLRPGERRFTLELNSGLLAAAGFAVVVKPSARGWLMTECQMLWVS